MSLTGALNIARSGLAVSQALLQTTGNNIANASDPNYTREVASGTPAVGQQVAPGIFIGNGVDLSGVRRQIDSALESRLRGSVSDSQAANTDKQWLGQLESAFNALGTSSLSAQESTFFNSWSNLANKPADPGLRQVVLQNGDSLAQGFQQLRTQLVGLQSSAGGSVKTLAGQADQLAQQIADLNGQIVTSGGSSGGNNSLLDQRDAAIGQLSQLINVQTIDQPNGVTNIYVGSQPLVLNAQNLGIGVKQTAASGTTTNGLVTYTPIFKNNNGAINATGGQLGALVGVQKQINSAVDDLDTQAHALIFELNKLHASGQGTTGFTSATASNTVADATVALNSPKTALKFIPTNGSFVVHVKQKDTGLTTSTLVQVGLNGQPTDTTLNSLKTSLGAINGVNATIAGGKLSIGSANPKAEISFSQDSSGTLAALGINNFYTGNDARNIAVNQTLVATPTLLAAAQNGDAGDNQTARAIAALGSTPVASLKGQSLTDQYQATINRIGTAASTANKEADAAQGITDTLTSQRSALSGVSLDEETVNLIRQQQAFQGAARLITTIDAMMASLFAIV